MDALIEPSFFGALPDADKLAAGFTASLREARTYEDLLDRARQFGQEQMFLIGARILSGTVSAEQAGEAFARLADVIIRAVHRAVEENFAAKHGRLRGQESAVLALGKLGGREMTAASDLDLIIVYDFDENEPQSDGARPLYGTQYFARVTQRLVSALAAQTNYGALYQCRHAAAAVRAAPGRSRPCSARSRAIRRTRPGPGSIWRSRARASSPARRRSRRASRR